MSNDADAERVAELAREVVTDHDPKKAPVQEYLGACYDAGLSWVHFPEGLGGLGVSRGLQAVADRILQGAGGPVPSGSTRWATAWPRRRSASTRRPRT